MRISFALATLLGLAVAGTAATGLAVAQDDPIAARQALMKQNRDAARVAGDMVKGATEFDAAAAAEAMQKIQDDMVQFVDLFPPGSEGGDADPAIWENMEDFRAHAEKLASDAAAAGEAASEGLEAFATAFADVGRNCGACHETYRQ